jgi:hypothetical protein
MELVWEQFCGAFDLEEYAGRAARGGGCKSLWMRIKDAPLRDVCRAAPKNELPSILPQTSLPSLHYTMRGPNTLPMFFLFRRRTNSCLVLSRWAWCVSKKGRELLVPQCGAELLACGCCVPLTYLNRNAGPTCHIEPQHIGYSTTKLP